MTIIECYHCGDACGKRYPDTGSTYASGGEQGYDEGIGENFTDDDGNWHCSAACRDLTIECEQQEGE